MEVSSHALAQQRCTEFHFDVAVFTNLTRDHLDYHHTMEEYFTANRFIEGSGTDRRVAVLNGDDEYGRALIKVSKKAGSQVLTYGLSAGDFHAQSLSVLSRGSRFDLVTPIGYVPVFLP